MGRDSLNGNGGPANDPTPARFGWRPDAPSAVVADDASVPPPSVETTAPISLSPPSNGHTNGHQTGHRNGYERSNGHATGHPNGHGDSEARRNGHANGHSNGGTP